MKNVATIIFLTLLSVFSVSTYGQITSHIFNTAGNWSTATNWKNSLIADDSTKTAIIKKDVIVDFDFSIHDLILPTNDTISRVISNTGSNRLKININGSEDIGISNRSDSAISFTLGGLVKIHNINTPEQTIIQTSSNPANSLVFQDNSQLILTTPVLLKNFGGPTFFNGDFIDTASVWFGSQNNVTFGPTADNRGYTGDFYLIEPTTVVSNTLVSGGLLFGNSAARFRSDGGSLQVNGFNSMKGRIVRNGLNNSTLDINANQRNVGKVTIWTGDLTIDVDPAVTILWLGNSSLKTWNGLISIVGFQEGVIRFGRDNTGLTAGQLAKISHDGTGSGLALDPNGYLIYAVPSLPVDLLFFTAKVEQNTTLLAWSTSSETNNDFFTIEKSTDGQNFALLGKLSSQGVTNLSNHYAYKDTEPAGGRNYYRLKQTDLDGRFQYLKTVTVQYQPTLQASIFPNPFDNQVTIQIPLSEKIDISLINAEGQLVYQQMNYIENKLTINLPEFASGIYFLKIKSKTKGVLYQGKVVRK